MLLFQTPAIYLAILLTFLSLYPHQTSSLPLPSLDFKTYDKNHDHTIDLTEYTAGILPALKRVTSRPPDPSEPSPSYFSYFFTSSSSSEDPKRNSKEDADADPSLHNFVPSFIASLSLIIATEIGDKTFFIAAILSMSHPRLLVFTGAFIALAVMTILSTSIGLMLPMLGVSRKVTHILGSVLFLWFGGGLLRDARAMEDKVSGEFEETEVELSENSSKKEDDNHTKIVSVNKNDAVDVRDELTSIEEEDIESLAPPVNKTLSLSDSMSKWSWDKTLTKSLTLTFLAEWGDRSQIATISLGASRDPIGVTIGGIIGHGLCTGLACIGGRMLAKQISEKKAAIAGGLVFVGFGVWGLIFG